MREEELGHRIDSIRKVPDFGQKTVKSIRVSVETNFGMSTVTTGLSLLYGSEVRTLNVNERKNVKDNDVNCLLSICHICS